jgi:type IV secretory pathway VirJ component
MRSRAARIALGGAATVALFAGGGWVASGTLRASVAATLDGSRATAGAHAALGDLPLHEVAVSGTGTTFAVLVTGDGGWAAADRALARSLAARGIPVAALDARAYLMRERSPEETSRDLARILAHYERAWRRTGAVVVGYSRGADLAPFMVSRLPTDARSGVRLVVLLGPSASAGFRFHLVDLLASVPRSTDRPVAPEVARLRGIPVLCISGSNDRDDICGRLAPAGLHRIVRAGGHSIHEADAPALADSIAAASRRAERRAR